MAFAFKKKESVWKAVRRLSRARIEHALQCLQDCRRVEAIHCARKEIKKARAVLRLVRKNMRRKDRRILRRLRKAANGLAGPRDAQVKLNTFQNLMRQLKEPTASTELLAFQRQLETACASSLKHLAAENGTASVEKRLRRAARKLKRVKLDGQGWSAICPGVRKAYLEGRRGWQTAQARNSSENFHQWRKRVKDLWYQVTLLRPAWPEQMDAMAHELEVLGEHLGDDHDLAVLRQSADPEQAGNPTSAGWNAFEALIDARQARLRAEALQMGARFYADKPAVFCSRLERYWRNWRRQNRDDRQVAGDG